MTDTLLTKTAVLLVLVLVLALLNAKTGTGWFKFVSFWAMNACLLGAAWFVLQVVTA